MNLQGVDPSSKPHPDLVWDLGRQRDRALAERLLRQLENRLCIHAGASGRLHADYRLHFSAEGDRMIVEPDARDLLDTFHHVSPQALRRTGLCLLPGRLHDRPGLLLARPGNTADEPLQAHPLKSALALIVSKFRQRGEAFLPVLIRGDLGELRGLPCLHLHRLQPDELPHLSPFERHDLQQAITRKLLGLYRDADRLDC